MSKTAIRGLQLLGLAVLAQSLGCAYALPPPTPPWQERLRIVANSPEAYVIRLNADRSHDYPVPADGRMVLTIPAYRHGCRVYLFNLVKISDGYDPVRDWTLEIRNSGGAVRQFSFRQLRKLGTDQEGYRILKVEG